jgi:molybdate transport system substrate-binding protein
VRRALGLAAIAALLLAAGAAAQHRAAKTRLTVFAAASLTDVFPKIDQAPRYSFAGSNSLAAQIRLGAPADVFASADMKLPNELYKEKRCSKPVVFARNRIVVIVPTSNPADIDSIFDLRRRGVKVVIAAPGVPVGDYTLRVLRKMKLASILSNVVSRETDVREVLAKVALKEADAGFVYRTDARASVLKVRALRIPAWAQPRIQYGICVARASSHREAAQAFVKRVLAPRGQRTLTRYGFLPRAAKH